MKISLDWIKEFVEIPKKLSAKELAELLTLRTCEVEGFEDQSEKFRNTVIGKVIEIKPHPNANKLKLCSTDIGGTAVQIVCGGKNVRKGMLVPVALPGALVDWHGKGEWVELKETEIRGEKSYGMICAGEEVGLPKCPSEEITDLSHLAVEPGTPLSHTLHLDDIIFEIDNKSITHRPDLWGHYGMAREFASFFNQPLKPYVPKVIFPKKGPMVKVDIAQSNICRRFLSVIMTGIKIEESPEWLKTRLQAVGLRPVNNIVDVTNYVMLELGYPMHAFDRRTVKNDHFVIRYAKNGETLETLDHKKRELTSEDALVTNGETALGLAGVMGGVNSEITKDTAEIILEVGNWNPVMIRKMSQRYFLRSDAAQRFEKSLDPEAAKLAMLRAIELILKICKSAKIAGPFTDVYQEKLQPIQISLNTATVNKKIGAEIPEKEMIRHLKSLGFGVGAAKKNVLKVTVPSWRATKDINIEDDLVEEVARMYGYEKIPVKLPDLPIRLPHENHERKLKHWARDILSLGLGFTEVSHYSFYSADDFKKCLLPEEPHITIENPLSEDQTHLRVSLMPNMLKSVAKNLNFVDEMKIFEIGRRYKKMEGSYFPLEEKLITAMVVKTKITQRIFFSDTSKPQKIAEPFYEAKGALEEFLKLFPSLPFSFEESKEVPPFAHPQKCADVFIHADKKYFIGQVFELHPVVLRNFDIEAEIGVFGLNFSILASIPLAEKQYELLLKFPGIDIDVSILADRKARNVDVESHIRNAEQILIRRLALIDIFEDPSLGKDKKSLTYRIRLQAEDRTLTDEEMAQAQKKIFENLQKAGYQIRGL